MDHAAKPIAVQKSPARRARKSAGRGRWRLLMLGLVCLVLAGVALRAALPWAMRGYVNRSLQKSPLYAGEIGRLEIQLWRGAYSIHDVHLSKRIADVPVPLFKARRVDFGLQWRALQKGRLTGWILAQDPELNFVDAAEEAQTQTGEGGPWLQIAQDLSPFTINRAVIRNGSVHFRVYQVEPPVNVYLSQIEATIDNLSNVRDETAPLFSTIEATAMAMDHAKLEFKMALDPFSYRPTFKLATRLLGLDVRTINDLALAYGQFDFERGWFDLVVEATANEGQLSGYAKPLFRQLEVFRIGDDLAVNKPLQAFWQALVGATTSLLKNQPRNQFGTRIPFTGDLAGRTTADIPASIGNTLHNAFIRAYLPSLEYDHAPTQFLQFEPPEFTDLLYVGDAD